MNPTDLGSETERRFIGLATRPLEALPEVHEEAQVELSGRMAYAAADSAHEAAVAAAAERLEGAPPSRWRPKAIAAGILLLLLAGVGAVQGLHFLLPKDFASTFGKATREIRARYEGTDDQRLERLRMLHEAAPDDPVAFEDYALNLRAMKGALPPNYRETWQRIDPDNGLWLYHEAALQTRKNRRIGDRTRPLPWDPKPAMELLRQAMAAPRLHSYKPEWRVHRLDGIRPPTNHLERQALKPLTFIVNMEDYPTIVGHGDICDLLSDYAIHLKEKQDREGLKDLMRTCERLCARLAADAASDNDLHGAVAISSAAWEIGDAAGKIGMTQEQAELENHFDSILTGQIRSLAPYKSLLLRDLPTASDDSVPRELYEASRRVELSFAERVASFAAAAVLLLVAIGVAIESLRRGKRVTGLAEGLAPLFRREDQALLFGAGVLAPLLWFFAISRGTPLGCLDMPPGNLAFPPHHTQALATLLLVLVLLVHLGKSRLTRCCGFLSLGSAKGKWVGRVIVIVTALLIPFAGFVREAAGRDQAALYKAAAYACWMPLLWLVWQACIVLFSPNSGSLGGVLLCRLILWPLLLATGLALLAHGAASSAERRWMEQDELGRWLPERGGITGLEARTTDFMAARYGTPGEKSGSNPEK